MIAPVAMCGCRSYGRFSGVVGVGGGGDVRNGQLYTTYTTRGVVVCGYVGMYVKIVSEIWKRNSKCIKNHVILCKGIGNVSVLNIGTNLFRLLRWDIFRVTYTCPPFGQDELDKWFI